MRENNNRSHCYIDKQLNPRAQLLLPSRPCNQLVRRRAQHGQISLGLRGVIWTPQFRKQNDTLAILVRGITT
jgi:hypothetical protein